MTAPEPAPAAPKAALPLLDPSEDPRCFSPARKWVCTVVVSLMTGTIALASSIHTAALVDLDAYFHVSREVSTLGVTTFLLGFGVGPLLFAPLSEVLGRNLIYRLTFFAYLAFVLGCALANNVASLLVFRFLSGFFGSPAVTNSGGSITDMWAQEHRSVPLALFSAGSFLGPIFGPLIGGWISEYLSWRWNFWFILIFSGVVYALMLVCLPETYALKLKEDKAKRLGIQLPKKDYRRLYQTTLTRPWIMLGTEPILTLLSLYTAFIYGILYLDFEAYPYVFETVRGWSPGMSGLTFLGIGVGMAVAVAASPYINRLHGRWVQKQEPLPEARLPHLIFTAWLIPVGLFWFAWTSNPAIHWAPSVVSGIPFGIGMITLFLGITSYLTDCYGPYAASALAGNAIMRSIFGAGFPLFSTQMYQNLGAAWATSLLGFLACALAPLPFVFYTYGPWLRSRSKFHLSAVALE